MKRGFITVKPNCSIQSYVPALHALREFGIDKVFVCTYQAISGAGKTFKDWPEMLDNVIPFIGGEEEKSEKEPLKVWGSVEADGIVNAGGPTITSQCIRVPVTDGHLAAVFVSFEKKPSMEQDDREVEELRGKTAEARAAQRAEAVPDLFHGRKQAADETGSGRGRRSARPGWESPSDGFARTGCWTTGSSACPTTPSGAPAGGAVLTAELLKSEGYLTAK